MLQLRFPASLMGRFMDMKGRITPAIEYVAESTAACLVTMVQGNLLALNLSHLVIASQTGVIAGAIVAVALFVSRTQNR